MPNKKYKHLNVTHGSCDSQYLAVLRPFTSINALVNSLVFMKTWALKVSGKHFTHQDYILVGESC